MVTCANSDTVPRPFDIGRGFLTFYIHQLAALAMTYILDHICMTISWSHLGPVIKGLLTKHKWSPTSASVSYLRCHLGALGFPGELVTLRSRTLIPPCSHSTDPACLWLLTLLLVGTGQHINRERSDSKQITANHKNKTITENIRTAVVGLLVGASEQR